MSFNWKAHKEFLEKHKPKSDYKSPEVVTVNGLNDVGLSVDKHSFVLDELLRKNGELTNLMLNEKIKKILFDWFVPVGYIYRQLPHSKEPLALWQRGTWENISSQFSGCFFRAEGGKALEFEGGKQANSFKSHYHSFGHKWHEGGTHGSLIGYKETRNTGHVLDDLSFMRGGNSGAETRPDNYTVRLWRRVA